MRNPNEVTYQTRTTSNKFITEYGFTSANYANSEFPHFQSLYGKDNVSMERRNSKIWIVIGQVLSTNETIRQTASLAR